MIQKTKSQFIKNAIFLSYTSLSDFLKCPRAYFLKNIYRDPKTGFRLQVASPYLSLGGCVHDAVEWYLQMDGQITKEQLIAKYKNFWLKYRGKKGGFATREIEADFGKRGIKMLDNFYENAGKLEKIRHTMDFPKLNLFDDVILMGNFDFVGEKEDETLHVIDFKTGANDEKDALQLYIYAILAEANFGKNVTSASYWYLDRDSDPREVVLDALEPKLEWINQKAKELKKVIEEGDWVCVRGEEMCNECRIYTSLIDGKGEFQFTDERYKKDIYYLNK